MRPPILKRTFGYNKADGACRRRVRTDIWLWFRLATSARQPLRPAASRRRTRPSAKQATRIAIPVTPAAENKRALGSARLEALCLNGLDRNIGGTP
jgi:hypothetical protein